MGAASWAAVHPDQLHHQRRLRPGIGTIHTIRGMDCPVTHHGAHTGTKAPRTVKTSLTAQKAHMEACGRSVKNKVGGIRPPHVAGNFGRIGGHGMQGGEMGEKTQTINFNHNLENESYARLTRKLRELVF